MNHNEGNWRDHRDELFDRVVQRGRARKRRRGLFVTATMLTLVLALVAGLYLPGRTSRSLRVANPVDGTTTVPTSPPATAFTDPFAGGPIPATGLAVTDDPKANADQGPSSFSMALFNDSGTALGTLPRATIENDVLNSPQHVLVVTDTGIHLEPSPLEATSGVPGGCTPTERNNALAVAVCGSGFGYNVLGNRILVNNGPGWSQLIALPPVASGSNPPGGHWAWATPSPDGRWVAAQWSGECEAPTGFFVSVADGSVHAVTGEAGTAWRSAPQSGIIGWQADGSAMGVFGGDVACGTSAPVQRGVYLVTADRGSRRLLLALTPSQGVLTWNAVDDQRTVDGAAGEVSVAYAYQHFFDPTLTADERAALVQDSAAMRAFMDNAFARHAAEVAAGKIIVDNVTVHGSTADVSFHAQLGSRESPANPGQINGTAVLEDGTWKISRSTFCMLSANDGEPCPVDRSGG